MKLKAWVLILVGIFVLPGLSQAQHKKVKIRKSTQSKQGGISSSGDVPTTALFTGVLEGIGQNIDFSKATVYLTMEDTSLADAPSETFIKITYQGVKKLPLLFTFHGRDDYKNNASYSVLAHIDTDSNGEINKGDYITTQHYPVRPGYPDEYVYLNVQLVK